MSDRQTQLRTCLVVDDDEGICELIGFALESEGLQTLKAHTGKDALHLLETERPMLVLLDLKLPDMDGRAIAEALSKRRPRIPFVVISGLANTQVAVDMMRQGAADFLIKDLAFLNLIPGVVQRVLAELERERKLQEAQSALRESEDRFRQLAENIRDVFYMLTFDHTRMLYISPAYEDVWGRKCEDLMDNSLDWLNAIVEEDRQGVLDSVDPLLQGSPSILRQYRIRRPDGSIRWIEDRSFPVFDDKGHIYRIAGLATDVTERRLLEQELLNISERERRRIGHDLHDDLCQRLAATKLKCEMLSHNLGKSSAQQSSELAREISKQIAEATALCRSIARGLSPVDLEGEGLMAAIAKLVQTAEVIFEVPCFFHCAQQAMVRSPTTAAHVYRIAQELVNNAARHAEPTEIHVTLSQESGHLKLEVSNDGKTFRGPVEATGGMGLKILRYRASAIGATVQFHPKAEPESGTVAVCLIPESSCNSNEPTIP